MQETLQVNIGNLSFTIDQDAHGVLKDYLHQIQLRLPEEDQETMPEIEARIAELLQAQLPTQFHVVTLNNVKNVMKQMGAPECFGDECHFEREKPKANVGLRRSLNDRALGGVCGGFAKQTKLDSTLIRLIYILLSLSTFTIFAWIYVILWVAIPEEEIAPDK